MEKTQKTTPLGPLVKTLLALSLGAFLASGCAAAPQRPLLPPAGVTSSSSAAEINNTLAAVALQNAAPSADYRLGPEDLLNISLFNIPESESGITPRTTEVRVSQQGKINLSLLGDLSVTGLTASALEQDLRERYKKYLRDPQVGVMVKEYHSQRVSVVGEVQKPGFFELTGPKTLIDMLAMAGGVTEKAGSQVHLYRQAPEGRQSYIIDLYALTNNVEGLQPPAAATVESLNLSVQAGDVINVPKAGMFFVDGAVSKPSSYPLDRPYTLSQALVAAGGIDRELAKSSGITIFRRRGPAQAETIAANLDEILAGNDVDPQIEAEDVVVVPRSVPKYLFKRFVGGLIYGFSLSSFMY